MLLGFQKSQHVFDELGVKCVSLVVRCVGNEADYMLVRHFNGMAVWILLYNTAHLFEASPGDGDELKQ